ncbi:MAG: glycine oxidase ThiO [Cyanobacteria bacterium J06632_22]
MAQADVLIVGGGIMGLAIAVDLRQQGATVTVLSQSFAAAAAHAAAGMLAPQAEKLSGPLFDLSQRSLALYPEWVQKLEALTGQSVGFWPCGVLVPHLSVQPLPHLPVKSPALQGADTLRHYQPGLSSQVTGGHFYPEEGQVDNRALTQGLRSAAESLGVNLQEGVTVEAFLQRQGRVVSVLTSVGEQRAGHYVLAAGAWSSELLPVPVRPIKGQLLSVRQPESARNRLKHVLYGERIYIVPRRDGRVILGATSETVGFAPQNTPAGIAQLLNGAIELYPEIQDFPLEECWWGFRPATPDELPVLGPSHCDNLTLATGHHRNGIMLAPITARLITQQVQNQSDPLLDAFSWQRFHLSSSPTMPTQFASAISSAAVSQSATAPVAPTSSPEDALVIAGRTFHSRLMTGTGKYSDFATMRQAVAASGSEIVTVAVRRVQTNAPGHEGLAEALDWQKIWMLPNTAGCTNAEEAIRVARLGREMAKLLGQEDNNFVKLEVIPDSKYLLPDPIGTLEAAEKLVKEGFAVLPYVNADPLLAKRLQEVGCATVMPLGSPIGSGQGIRNAANIQIIVENATVPVVVDAGIGTPSEAAAAMELGADALLINTAIAKANNPVNMGYAMGLATQAGRLAYQSGRIPVKAYASASSPLTGKITG